MKDWTESEVLDMNRDHIKVAGSVRALARLWGVQPSYLCDLRDGRRAPGPKILGPLGLERIKTVVYRRTKT